MAKTRQWTDLSGSEIKGIYNKEHDLYSTSIGRNVGTEKKPEYENQNFGIYFSKNCSPEIELDFEKGGKTWDKFSGIIEDGWLSLGVDKKGNHYTNIFINKIG